MIATDSLLLQAILERPQVAVATLRPCGCKELDALEAEDAETVNADSRAAIAKATGAA